MKLKNFHVDLSREREHAPVPIVENMSAELPRWLIQDSIAFKLGFQTIHVGNPKCMLSHLAKIVLKVFQFYLKSSQHTV